MTEEMIKEIEEAAKGMARELCNECDGSYVGAEMDKVMPINGDNINIHVVAFWDRSNWFEYSAKGEDFEHNSKDTIWF